MDSVRLGASLRPPVPDLDGKLGLSDEEILVRLYERTLARKPKIEEIDTCKRYLKKTGNRQEALEDVFWSLVNSTEFVTKR